MNHQITSDITKIPLKWLLDNIRPLEPNQHLSNLDFWELLSQSHCFVYLLDDSPIAFSRWVSDGHVFSSLCDLYVVPERRRQGFGSRLVQHNFNSRLIAPTVKLLRYSNPEAEQLYIKLGFQYVLGNDQLMIKYAQPDFIKNI